MSQTNVPSHVKILIIDDSEFDRQRFIRALNGDLNTLYEFYEIDHGEELESVTQEWKPDLVILDYNLPIFNGLELLRKIFEKFGKIPFPFVMATGTGDEPIAVEAMKLGALDYMAKDGLSSDIIRQVLKRALEKSALQQKLFKQQKLLEQSERRLELTINSSGLGIWEWDLKSDRLFWSPETEKIMGYLPEESRWRNLEDFSNRIHPDDRKGTFEKFSNAIKNKTQYQHEFMICLPDGNIRWVSNSGRADYDHTGKPILMRGTVGDITERKLFEKKLIKSEASMRESHAALIKSQTDLRSYVDELQIERELRERFVNTLSHDLRNPLTVAWMTATLIRKKTVNNEVLSKMVGKIEDSISRANQMISDLLDANRIKAGEKLPVEIEAYEMNKIILDTLTDLQVVHGDRFVFTATNRIHGHWSRSGVRRILENLCNNAIKYGTSNRPVTIILAVVEKWVKIEVHNEGFPISAEDQSKLFNSFIRTELAQAGKEHGWGLGLALVRGLAEAHGGSVGVKSYPIEGTTFWVQLPFDSRPKA